MSQNNYILTVIIPVYNAEHTIQNCLESILNQSYKKFELILVDDGSTDNSPILCDEYARVDCRVKTIHQKNSGPFQARKTGAEMASGKILTFSDADDYFEERAFEEVMQVFNRFNPDILAYTYYCENGKAEKHLYSEGLYCRDKIREEIIPGMMYDSVYGKRRLNPSLCCKFIKKSLFVKVTESVNDRITLGDDALVTYPAVCMAENIFVWNKALYHYSINSVSCTHRYPLERIFEIKAFQDNLFRLFSEIGVFTQVRWQAENYVRSFLAVMVRKWYGIELSPVLFSFPYNLFQKGSCVLIYGAGDVGKSYISELILTNYVEIAGWADKNYSSIKEYHNVEIISPEQIREKEFDWLLIAIQDKGTAEKVSLDLIGIGIAEEKIVWSKPIRFL